MKPSTLQAKALAQCIASSTDQKQLALAIAAYLVETRQSKSLYQLLRMARTERAKGGVVEAIVTTAHPLPAAEKSRIQALVTRYVPSAETVLLVERIDPSIIGSVHIAAEGKEFDASLRGKLDKLRYRSA